MAKYRERIPTMIVDISEWNPGKGKPYKHTAVAAERMPDGTWRGTIHKVNGENIGGILPGSLIVTYPTTPTPTYAVIKPEDVEDYFELIDDETLKLAESTGAFRVPTGI
jgi:hypothetical protein